MVTKDLVIVGAGGHGRETLDVLRASNQEDNQINFLGFVSDEIPNPNILSRINAEWLGSVRDFLSRKRNCGFIIGVGDPNVRFELAPIFERHGMYPVSLVHPSATIGSDVNLGAGTLVCSHVSITTSVRIGNHTHVNLNSTISHDCRISNFVTVSPHCSITGNVAIHNRVHLGTHSSILPGITIGEGCVVGAGAVVTSDTPANTTVAGVPARQINPSI